MDRLLLDKKRALSDRYRNNCFIHVQENKDPSIAVHEHSFLEIVYITQGSGIHQIGNESFRVAPGDIFILSIGAWHTFQSDNPADPLRHYDCLLFLDAAAEQVDYSLFSDMAADLFYNVLFPGDVNRSPYIYLRDADGALRQVLSSMARECSALKPDSDTMLFGFALQLLVLLSRLYHSEFDENETIRIRREGIHNAIRFLEKNYSQRISLNELSRIALFSPNYFCTLFKETTGLSVTEYIQQIRNKEAGRLLVSTDLTVRDICQRVGYSDEKLFRRVFSRSEGCTPGEYRKRFKQSKY